LFKLQQLFVFFPFRCKTILAEVLYGVLYLFFLSTSYCLSARPSLAVGKPIEVLNPGDLQQIVGLSNRSAGSVGAERFADYILKEFRRIGLDATGVQNFFLPLPDVDRAVLEIDNHCFPLHIWMPNLAYLSNTPAEGLSGRCLYLKRGTWEDFERAGKIDGSIVFLDLDSGDAWLYAAMFGARAVVYFGFSGAPAGEYRRKYSSAPLAFPRYWLPPAYSAQVRQLITKGKILMGNIKSRATWKNAVLRNVYGILSGSDPKLREELIIIEARYDARSLVPGIAPGVDEATAVLTMLNIARYLSHNRPKRSVMFLATSGSGYGAAGMREFVWAVTSSSKNLRRERRYLRHQIQRTKRVMRLLKAIEEKRQGAVANMHLGLEICDGFLPDNQCNTVLWPEIVTKAKNMADDLILRQFHGRATQKDADLIRKYRIITWKHGFSELNAEEWNLITPFFKELVVEKRKYLRELCLREQVLRSAIKTRSDVRMYDIVLVVPLNISTYSPYLRLQGWGATFPFRAAVTQFNRVGRFVRLALQTAAKVSRLYGMENLFLSSRSRNVGVARSTTPSASPVMECPCCDVASIGGMPAVHLNSWISVPPLWGTPDDVWERWNILNFVRINKFLAPFFLLLANHSTLTTSCRPGIAGLANVEGKAMFIRQGELFPDRPAPGTLVTAQQGRMFFRALSFMDGRFFLHGVANKKVSYQKLILEPYGIDPTTGRIRWATDKRETGKPAYRIKIKGTTAHTTLIMFPCEQTDVIGVFHPRKLSFVTKVKLIDARTGSIPTKYWYSRVDGRDTVIISVFLEPGTHFKLILADSLLTRDVLLLNSSTGNPEGKGFLIGHPAMLRLGPLQAAEDTLYLVRTRITAFKRTDIRNSFIESLYNSAQKGIDEAKRALAERRFAAFWTNTIQTWAILNQVYHDIESTQKDVLLGVVFFIVLFVPFAYCLERYIFCFTSIYKQIVAFFAILFITIAIIRVVHPAFRLTYSPTMVIIAFFIVGLSILVGWIILGRFEQEMETLQRASIYGLKVLPAADNKALVSIVGHVKTSQALGAALAIGVSNLHRRILRTALTCLTLMILTFTIMSFTSVKSFQRVLEVQTGKNPLYQGLLIHHPLWFSLTDFALRQMQAIQKACGKHVFVRAWMDRVDPYKKELAVLAGENGAIVGLEGIMGMSSNAPERIKQTLLWGRWLKDGCYNEIVISSEVARALNVNLNDLLTTHHSLFNAPPVVSLFGMPFVVVGVFDAEKFGALRDLDGQALTPAYLEMHPEEELTEVEVEAIESGEEVLPISERFYHASAEKTVIIPVETCMALGGHIKAIHLLGEVKKDFGTWFAYPFFIGKGGEIFFHSAITAVKYQGMTNLIVPLLIVVLICLNTLIGQVHERKREIAIYTSVGLAPHHVGMLFIMEALSFAVLSCVTGYLLAQFTAKYLTTFSFFKTLTFNYSSLSSVMSMILVFGVVLVASIYPARVATDISMPDVERTWTLPRPNGDLLIVELPFLFPIEDRAAVLMFLADYINMHQDVAHGVFMSDGVSTGWADWAEVQVEPYRISRFPQCFLLQTSVWLAPFDFGIKQRVQMYCCSSLEEPEYVNITIRIIRLSGEAGSWHKANENFIREIRKQLLRWHTLGPALKQAIREGISS